MVASQGVEAVAKRVDSVLEHLTEQLSNFEAADSSTLGGVPATSVISGAMAMYFQTFENDVTEDWHLRSGSIAAVTYPNNGKAGGRALRTTNKAVWIADNTSIPFDPARLYRIRTRVRDVSGSHRTVRVGVEGRLADGVTPCDRAGNPTTGALQNLVCRSGALSATAWTEYTGYFKGVAASGNATSPSTNAALPRVLHTNTRYIAPFVSLSEGGNDQVCEIDYITLEVLTETLESNEIVTKVGGRDVTAVASTVKSAGGVAADNVDNAAIAANAVTGGNGGSKQVIELGTITAGCITVTELSAIKGVLGTIYAGIVHNLETSPTAGIRISSGYSKGAGWVRYIDLAPANPTDPIFKFPGIEILDNGTATFSGTVSAANFTASTITMDGSLILKCGEATTLAQIFPVAADSAGLLLQSTIANQPGFTLYNTGAARLILTDTRDGSDVRGTLGVEVPVEYTYARYQSWIATFGVNDTTPSVADSGYPVQLFQTANTGATTITDFDDQQPNQVITIIVKDSVTTFGFSGARLEGNNDADWLATDGDVFQFIYNYTDDLWHLISVVPHSRDNSVTPLYQNANVAVADAQITGALNHDGATYGFCGAVPSAQSTGWDISNVTPDKTYDANSTTTDELADVLGTLIAELVVKGLISDVT